MSVLTKYLNKLGVKDFSELSSEEKETYRTWEETLSGRKITDEDVDNFFDMELNEVLIKLRDPKVTGREDVFLKMKMEFIMKVKEFLKSPEIEKRMLEKNIENMV